MRRIVLWLIVLALLGLAWIPTRAQNPVAMLMGDNIALPVIPMAGAVNLCYDGTNLDLCRASLVTEVTEDLGETLSAVGHSLFGVRRDTPASSAGTSGDNATLNLDALGKLWANVDLTLINGVALLAGAGNTGTGSPRVTEAANSLLTTEATRIASATEDAAGTLTAIANALSVDVAEDDPNVSGKTGPLILGVRRDTAASSSGTDGDYSTLNVDASGRLWVNCGTGCSGGSGTQFAEDFASANLDVGTLAMARRTATPANTSGTDLDYEVLQMSAGRLWASTVLTDGTDLALVDASGNLQVLCSNCSGSGASMVDNAAFTGGTSSVAPMGALFDATPPTITDGSIGAPRMDSTRYLYTVFPSAQAVTGTFWQGTQPVSGTVTANLGTLTAPLTVVGNGAAATALRVTLANDSTGIVALTTSTASIGKLAANSGVDIGDVDVLTINGIAPAFGTGVRNAQTQRVTLATDDVLQVLFGGKVEDDTHTNGDAGNVMLARRANTASSSTGTDLDYSVLNVDGSGKLWTNAEVTVALPAGTNNIGDVDISSWPALAAGTNNIGDVDVLTVPADPFGANADASSATGSISAKLRFIASTGIPITGTVTVASHAVTNAGTFATQSAPTASAAGGATGLSYVSVGTTEDEHAVMTAAGTLYSITVTNTNAAVRYLRCENDTAAGTAPGTDTPEISLAIPGQTIGAGFTTTFPVGFAFSTGLTCWLVTGAAITDVAEVAANEIQVVYTFKQ